MYRLRSNIKQVFGITFEQGRNELVIDENFFDNIVTENKEIPESAKMDLDDFHDHIKIHTVQFRMLCQRRTGNRYRCRTAVQNSLYQTCRLIRQITGGYVSLHRCLDLQFVDKIGRADRDNAIDLYIGEDYMDVLADGAWENIFKVKPEVFTREEKRAWLDKNTDVALGSDAFFPFGDNVERAHKSGVKYIAQPGGSIRDDHVIATCNKYGIAMAFTGIRLFHH